MGKAGKTALAMSLMEVKRVSKINARLSNRLAISAATAAAGERLKMIGFLLSMRSCFVTNAAAAAASR
jgi:hypothetical protein